MLHRISLTVLNRLNFDQHVYDRLEYTLEPYVSSFVQVEGRPADYLIDVPNIGFRTLAAMTGWQVQEYHLWDQRIRDGRDVHVSYFPLIEVIHATCAIVREHNGIFRTVSQAEREGTNPTVYYIRNAINSMNKIRATKADFAQANTIIVAARQRYKDVDKTTLPGSESMSYAFSRFPFVTYEQLASAAYMYQNILKNVRKIVTVDKVPVVRQLHVVGVMEHGLLLRDQDGNDLVDPALKDFPMDYKPVYFGRVKEVINGIGILEGKIIGEKITQE